MITYMQSCLNLNVSSGEELKIFLKVGFADRIREVVLTDG